MALEVTIEASKQCFKYSETLSESCIMGVTNWRFRVSVETKEFMVGINLEW